VRAHESRRLTETERLDLLVFVHADSAKAVSIDRVNRLATLERALLEWPTRVNDRQHLLVRAERRLRKFFNDFSCACTRARR
jgi:hypothetical protein